jgi:heme A synthase
MDRVTRYAWLTLAWNVAVILWGAVVRATGSGAGCGSHWPLCNGEVVPRAPGAATLVEYSHRLTSGLALLMVAGLVVCVFRSRPRRHPARAAAAFSLLFILGEAAVGAGLVLFELVADNASVARALFMATHLVNTFLLVGALALTAHWAGGGRPLRLRGRSALVAGVGLALGGVLLVGISGAVAALGDTLFPAASLAEALRQDLSSTAHVLLRLRLLHPALAAVVGLGVLLLAFQHNVSHPGSAHGRSTAALVVVQMLTGVLNVSLLAPVWLQIAHLLLADLLWISLLLLGATALGEGAAESTGLSAVALDAEPRRP